MVAQPSPPALASLNKYAITCTGGLAGASTPPTDIFTLIIDEERSPPAIYRALGGLDLCEKSKDCSYSVTKNMIHLIL